MIQYIQTFGIIKYQKDNEYCTRLSVILLDSIFVNLEKKYYPQIFLEECKYVIQDRKIINTINKDLELSEPDDESDVKSEDESEDELQHIK